MRLPQTILGKAIVDQLQARQAQAVLIIGEDRFTRRQLAKIDCFNFIAAARLTAKLNDELKVKNTKDLFQRVPPQHLAMPGIGGICLATIGAAFEAMGVGNLESYIARHTEKGHSVVTFSTMKHNVRDIAAATKEKREQKTRTAKRRRQAHEHRVERFVERVSNGKTADTLTPKE